MRLSQESAWATGEGGHRPGRAGDCLLQAVCCLPFLMASKYLQHPPSASASATQSRSTPTQRPAAATARVSVLEPPSLPLALSKPRTVREQDREAPQGSEGPKKVAEKG